MSCMQIETVVFFSQLRTSSFCYPIRPSLLVPIPICPLLHSYRTSLFVLLHCIISRCLSSHLFTPLLHLYFFSSFCLFYFTCTPLSSLFHFFFCDSLFSLYFHFFFAPSAFHFFSFFFAPSPFLFFSFFFPFSFSYIYSIPTFPSASPLLSSPPLSSPLG